MQSPPWGSHHFAPAANPGLNAAGSCRGFMNLFCWLRVHTAGEQRDLNAAENRRQTVDPYGIGLESDSEYESCFGSLANDD